MSTPQSGSRQGGFLDLVERLGNRLPDPTTLFLVGTLLVMVLSHIAAMGDWTVIQRLPERVTESSTGPGGQVTETPVLGDDGKPLVQWRPTGKELKATSLLTRDGFFWAIESLVDNFMGFPPLGVVLVGMLGIGVAERTGFIAACLKAFMAVVPGVLLTPAMIFIGIMSSAAMDAGYIVLPPLAAALYKAVGRSPMVGLAAVFAGVSAGFNANLFITGLDPMLSEFTETGAQMIRPDYRVAASCNWYFLIGSTVVVTAVGWMVTSFFVERRLSVKPPEDGGPVTPTTEELEEQRMTGEEKRALNVAAIALAVAAGIVAMLIYIPGAPLHTPEVEEGDPAKFSRWVEVIVPLILVFFLTPGVAYGIAIGNIRRDKDLAKLFTQSMANMAPIIVLAFFAAQFIEYFNYCGLGTMLATWGGQTLGQANMPVSLLLVVFILVTLVFNLLIGSMSAKYAFFAPIFVPMFMLVGISPELTQAAYRIGDSTSNIITPLNPYLVIILVFMQKIVPRGGMGTLISAMLPYTIVFTIIWTIFLLIWVALGVPLGPGAPLEFNVTG